MPDYSKGKIYTIRCKTDDTKIYVGSTIQPLSVRFAGHKGDSKKNYRWYKEIDNWDNWYIELYENYPCNTREELNKREGEIIRMIGNLNKNIAGRTLKEYDDERKNKPERIQQKKEISKKYRERNKDSINERQANYYSNNKEKVNEKFKCECGCEVYKKHLKEHQKTQKHINLISSLSN